MVVKVQGQKVQVQGGQKPPVVPPKAPELKKEVVVAPKTEVANVPEVQDWGVADELTPDDLSRQFIGLVDFNSKKVKAGTVRAGAIINLMTNQELGFAEEKPVEFVVVGSFKYWIQSEVKKEKKGNVEKEILEFHSKYPASDSKEFQHREEIHGKIFQRDFNMAYMLLLVSDLAEGVNLPYQLTLRSTALQASRELANILFKMRAQQVPSHERTFHLGGKTTTKGEWTWYTPTIKLGREVTEDERPLIKEARDFFASQKAKLASEATAFEQTQASEGNSEVKEDAVY